MEVGDRVVAIKSILLTISTDLFTARAHRAFILIINTRQRGDLSVVLFIIPLPIHALDVRIQRRRRVRVLVEDGTHCAAIGPLKIEIIFAEAALTLSMAGSLRRNISDAQILVYAECALRIFTKSRRIHSRK